MDHDINGVLLCPTCIRSTFERTPPDPVERGVCGLCEKDTGVVALPCPTDVPYPHTSCLHRRTL